MIKTFCIHLILAQILLPLTVSAFVEFHDFVRKNSGRAINCAQCHTHPDGPDGIEPGQLDSFSDVEMERLIEALDALKPGVRTENPLLNEFGNQMVFYLGMDKINDLKSRPRDVADELGYETDIDGDGIPDAQEYLDGTLPTDVMDGNPWLLFKANFRKNIYHIVLAILSIALIFYGFAQFLKGLRKSTSEQNTN